MIFKKISVLIVTYKQADVIARNIESILQQKEYGLHEIVICDDCSPDNNWEVIQSYVQQYPNIIRAYRNTPNLGIYGNSDKCASLHGDADLFCWLEGDDALEPGVFKAIQEKINTDNISMDEALGIFCDYSSIDPYNRKIRHPNNLVISGANPLSLFIRGMVSWRASFFTHKVIEKFVPSVLDKGLALAELLFDSQWFRNINKCYYCPVEGSIYYTEIGVSVGLGFESSFKKEQALIKWKYLLDNHFCRGLRDRCWLKFKIMQATCFIKKSWSSLFKSIPNYIFGMFGFGLLDVKKMKSNFAPMLKYIVK